MNKDHFRQAAPKSIVAKIATRPNDKEGQDMLAVQKEFSTGSVGWYGTQKMLIEVGGEQVNCVVNVTITAAGSKNW